MTSPEICIIKTDGINCDEELSHAFQVAGGSPETVHINQIRSGEKKLADYAGVGLPGGFSYGDDIASGAVLANELTAYLGEELQTFIDDERPVIGICNGFQVLTRTGLLPDRQLGTQHATLAHNNVGHFIREWVDLEVKDNRCVFVPSDKLAETVPMEIAHGEGRFVASEEKIQSLQENGQIVFTYTSNPNGSTADIAGICDPTGLILGMMPHPERSIASYHPDRRRSDAAKEAAQIIFKNFVKHAREM